MPNISNIQWNGRRGDPGDIVTGPTNNSGGDLSIFTASGTLLVGDVVYLSAANTVAKSVTPANYAAFIGVVVGGESTNDFVAQDIELQSATQLTAALTGKRVIVQTSGIAHVISGGVIAAGAAVSGDTGTAGRVLGGAGAIAGQIIGTMITAGTAASNALMLIRPR